MYSLSSHFAQQPLPWFGSAVGLNTKKLEREIEGGGLVLGAISPSYFFVAEEKNVLFSCAIFRAAPQLTERLQETIRTTRIGIGF